MKTYFASAALLGAAMADFNGGGRDYIRYNNDKTVAEEFTSTGLTDVYLNLSQLIPLDSSYDSSWETSDWYVEDFSYWYCFDQDCDDDGLASARDC